MVEKSCPALVVHVPDDYRKKLIASLDEKHFAVTVATDGDEAISALAERPFNVVLLGISLKNGTGAKTLEYPRSHRDKIRCGIILLGDPDPALRTHAPWVDETLLKPADADYVATRARTYCGC
jgi:DNA-binding response OmpR family regulator